MPQTCLYKTSKVFVHVEVGFLSHLPSKKWNHFPVILHVVQSAHIIVAPRKTRLGFNCREKYVCKAQPDISTAW